MDFGIGDILQVTKLAWDLYQRCFVAARDAPDEFRQLHTELGTLQGLLCNLRDDVNSDRSFEEKLEPRTKDFLNRCLRSCFQTLQKLCLILGEYQRMGFGDGVQFWRRISWTTQREAINDMKLRIISHHTMISAYLNNLDIKAILEIVHRLLPALERQERSEDVAARTASEGDDVDTPLPLLSNRYSVDPSEAEPTSMRQHANLTRADTRPQSPPSATRNELESTSQGSSPRFQSPSYMAARTRRASSAASRNDPLGLHRTSEDERNETRQSARSLLSHFPPNFTPGSVSSTVANARPSLTNKETEPIDIQDELTSVRAKLHKVEVERDRNRPLKLPPTCNIPSPDDKVAAQFQIYAEEETQYININTREWLLMGTWWLLKARFGLQTMQRPKTTSSATTSSGQTTFTVSSTQGYVDLLKASWIVFKIVLAGDYETSLRVDENRDVLYHLVDGLNYESKIFRNGIPDLEAMNHPDISYQLWEPMQAREESFGEDFGSTHSSRWITVQQSLGGALDEKLLFRTFVDAAIGAKGQRVYPKGGPYLLVLSTKEGESEPKITLCNQRGTICLTRDFTVQDLKEFSSVGNSAIDMDPEDGLQSLELSFEGLPTSISFPNENDLQRLLQTPRFYFDAVQRREPRMLPRATEALIFKSSVDVIEQLHPSSMKVMSNKHRFESCDIRILETTCKEGWRTTRRLVTSSSASEKDPWCNEFFLPMDRVQLSSEYPREVIMKWSDCSQEDYTKTNGEYVTVYSHVYNDLKPNNAFRLMFNNEDEAAEFQNAILSLRRKMTHTWENGASERGHIYEIDDTDPDPKKYKAIMVVRRQHEFSFSQIFYHYRDTDFDLDSKSYRLLFPALKYTHYISTHHHEVYRPTSTPKFSHCEARPARTTLDFLEANTAMAFLSALCGRSNAKLVFVRRAAHVSTKAPSLLFGGSTKSNKGPAEVSVWREGNTARVVSRWFDHVSDKWVSAKVETGALKHNSGDRASLPNARYERGQKLDMTELVAVTPSAKDGVTKREGHLTWAFNSYRDQEDFITAVEGRPPGQDQISQLEEYLNRMGQR